VCLSRDDRTTPAFLFFYKFAPPPAQAGRVIRHVNRLKCASSNIHPQGFVAYFWQLRKKITATAGFLTHLLGDSGQKCLRCGAKIAYKSMTKKHGEPLWQCFSNADTYA
jgi:hypothetical protein